MCLTLKERSTVVMLLVIATVGFSEKITNLSIKRHSMTSQSLELYN